LEETFRAARKKVLGLSARIQTCRISPSVRGAAFLLRGKKLRAFARRSYFNEIKDMHGWDEPGHDDVATSK